MTEPRSINSVPEKPQEKKHYLRFDIFQRLEHLTFLLSFSMLGMTGLIQKFATSPLPEFLIRSLGGIETTRIIHRTSSVVMMVVAVFHIIGVLYRIIVRRVSLDMLPTLDDFKHLFQDLLYYLGLRDRRGFYGRYNYAEKVEYFAVVWGTLIMGITGFMMWNPIATTRFLPGEFIPAAKAAHGGEAILAVLAIVLWHFYHVHLRHFNKSMFTGVLTREEMEHEHPAELARIESGQAYPTPSPEVSRKRQRIFIPTAVLLTAMFGFAIFQFTTLEETAIRTIPPGESVQVFVPQTPTPEPTRVSTPTSEVQFTTTWQGGMEGLFRNRCSTCHGFTSVGGLSLATYEQALQGGDSGLAIVPGEPEASFLVEIQSTGNHPGQLSDEELELVIQWILAGAPEK